MALRACILLPFAVTLGLAAQQVHSRAPDQVTVDASAVVPAPETGYLHLGGVSSDGHSLQVNSQYLVLDGKPWLPVMGEFHFSRYSETQWEDEILKMKAAGVDIISTYVFWIHHEEIQGRFDWSGQRDLRRFVQLCGKHGMYVWLRVGPWAHGEVRNGGFPDWIQSLPNTRTNDPTYIHYVETFFNQVGLQVQGLMFKDGGPIIGTQLENEYGLHGPGRGAEHILKLKQLAIAAGIDTPLYSVTAWPSLDFPPQEVVPVSGGYPDGFWFGSQTRLPPSMTYLFNFNRELGDMGATAPSEDPTGKVNLKHYPYVAAEEAGGMAAAYHRRPLISADDIAALTLTGLGSGINLYGYYMFQGGANPRGLLSTLQESSASAYPNDLPEINYDFQAPLGEFGQERESYRKTRMLHLFLNAFGPQLATMPSFSPARRTRDAANTAVPRLAVRTDGRSGFIFCNNYVRQLPMPARPGLQVHIRLPDTTVTVPASPVDIPANSYFVWPFNLALGKTILQYSTAQLLTQLETPSGKLVVFFAVPGVQPEFSFAPATMHGLTSAGALIQHRSGSTIVRTNLAGENTTIHFDDTDGAQITILLLSEAEAEQTSLLHIANADHLVMSSSSILFDGHSLHLRATVPSQQCAILPELPIQGVPGKHVGLWTTYTFNQPEKHPTLSITQMRTAVPRASMAMGPYIDWRKTAVPAVPPDSAFDKAAKWQIRWDNPDMSGLSEALLQIDYTGDTARLLSTTSPLDDDFFNGQPWQVGLKRFLPSAVAGPLTLEILPMPKIAPIYLDQRARALLGPPEKSPQLKHVQLLPEYESIGLIEP